MESYFNPKAMFRKALSHTCEFALRSVPLYTREEFWHGIQHPVILAHQNMFYTIFSLCDCRDA